jgi:hypothetical protein
VHRVCLFTCLTLLACTDQTVDSGVKPPVVDSTAGVADQGDGAGAELIPAEWTVFEDTSSTGEVTTASLQLPAAKEIEGLLQEEAPRLLLRCVEGRVQASIHTDPSAGTDPGQDDGETPVQTVQIQLDSAPACE